VSFLEPYLTHPAVRTNISSSVNPLTPVSVDNQLRLRLVSVSPQVVTGPITSLIPFTLAGTGFPQMGS
jgi:hypothetical protein